MAFVIFQNGTGTVKSGSPAGEVATGPFCSAAGPGHAFPICTHTNTCVHNTCIHTCLGVQFNIQKHWHEHRWRMQPNPVPLMASSN